MGCCLVAVDVRNGWKPCEGISIPRVGELTGATHFSSTTVAPATHHTTPHTLVVCQLFYGEGGLRL
jgi:hypothetical protein